MRFDDQRGGRQAPHRGYVALLVIFLLVALSAAGATVYRSSAAHRHGLNAVRHQSDASANASLGVQVAVGRLRSGALTIHTQRLPCPADLLNAPFYCSGLHASFNGAGNGGETIYDVRVYSRQGIDMDHETLIVDSFGYYGREGSASRTESRIEAEIYMGQIGPMGDRDGMPVPGQYPCYQGGGCADN